METTVSAEKKSEATTKIEQGIREQLSAFEHLIGQFTYGAPIVEANGGHHVDKGLLNPAPTSQQPHGQHHQQQAVRCSLLPAFMGGEKFTFGPLSNSKAIVGVASEGEESEVDITDFLILSAPSHHQQLSHGQAQFSHNSGQSQQRTWSAVQEAWSQAPTQISNNTGTHQSSFLNQQFNLDKLHPHNQKQLNGRIALEEKGGPRIRDVLEQLVDLKSLRPFTQLKQLPVEHVYSGWLHLYDNSTHLNSLSNSHPQHLPHLDTRPSVIHVYPNQKLANLQALQHEQTASKIKSREHSSSDNTPPESMNAQQRHSGHYQAGAASNASPVAIDTICLVQFQDPAALEYVYKVLRDARKSILNEAKQPIRFGMAYDARCLGETAWSGVILRNLPSNATSKGIMNNFEVAAKDTNAFKDYQGAIMRSADSLPYHIIDLPEPVKIRGQYCTVLTVPDIEEAERICLLWNRFDLDKQNKLKAHLHPYSYRKRPSDKLSLHPLFHDRYDPFSVLDGLKQERQTAADSMQPDETRNGYNLPQPAIQSDMLGRNEANVTQNLNLDTQDKKEAPKTNEVSIQKTTQTLRHLAIKTEETAANDAQGTTQQEQQHHQSNSESLVIEKTVNDPNPPKNTEVTTALDPEMAMKTESSPSIPQKRTVAQPKLGLLALLDEVDYEVHQQPKQREINITKPLDNCIIPSLAIMDEVFEEGNVGKKKAQKLKRRRMEQRKREHEQQVNKISQQEQLQQKEQQVGKRRPRDDQTQSKLVDQHTISSKRMKKDEQITLIKDEVSQVSVVYTIIPSYNA